ncbi:MAG: tetraacyldisaccharide 4'-kinase [Gammaproteobacteria bacterium]|nr:tetraacyldisaccharide 4'-kinase [Gammaproteobacteria bacterium]
MQFPHWWLKRNLISWLLWPCSRLFALIVLVRRFFYRIHLFPTYTSPLPIIIVGNINVGGTGKTPLVIALANQLKKEGKQPAILSRGYRSVSKTFPLAVTVDTPVILAGDEPLMMAQQTGCLVVIDPHRVRGVKYLEQSKQCDVIICDDGLQHYALGRALEILVVDGQRGFGNGFLLPAGMLREPISRAQTVDMVVCNGDTSSDLPRNAFTMKLTVGAIRLLSDPTQTLSIEDFMGKATHAVAGIGHPERFFNLLRRYGLEVIPHPFPDHHQFTPKDFDFLSDENTPILMTEKDAVKCMDMFCKKTNVWYMQVTAQLSDSFYEKINDILAK